MAWKRRRADTTRTGARRLVAAGVVGYLAGTTPSADIATRIVTGGETDLRASGSGNPGAANAGALLGTGWGLGVMAADIGKAAVACVAGRRLAGDNGAHVAGTASVIGHCFPFHNGFRGGKGVAASVGQCAATFPAYSPIDMGVALATSMVPWWRRRSFGAIVASSACWTGAGVLWWRRGWSNAWGPTPSAALPLASGVTSTVIIHKFVRAAALQDELEQAREVAVE